MQVELTEKVWTSAAPWLQNSILTVEKAAETPRLHPGKYLSGCLICCELIVTKWFCLLRVKWCIIRWAVKAVDKNDHKETIWSWHRENNLTSLERDLKVHTVAHASTWLPGRIHCHCWLTQTLHCREERFRSGPLIVCHLSLPCGAVARWSMTCHMRKAQPWYLLQDSAWRWQLGKFASDSSLLVCPSVVC